MLVIWIAVIGLSGCDMFDRNISIASEIIKKNLKSPSSYSPGYSKIVWEGKNQKGNPAYIARIEYEADNLFCASLSECKFVAFTTEGESYYWNTMFALDNCISNKGRYVETKVVEMLVKTNFKN